MRLNIDVNQKPESPIFLCQEQYRTFWNQIVCHISTFSDLSTGSLMGEIKPVLTEKNIFVNSFESLSVGLCTVWIFGIRKLLLEDQNKKNSSLVLFCLSKFSIEILMDEVKSVVIEKREVGGRVK